MCPSSRWGLGLDRHLRVRGFGCICRRRRIWQARVIGNAASYETSRVRNRQAPGDRGVGVDPFRGYFSGQVAQTPAILSQYMACPANFL